MSAGRSPSTARAAPSRSSARRATRRPNRRRRSLRVVDRPSVRCNQLGYLPDGPKRAVWVTGAEAPARFRVLDARRRRGRDRGDGPWAVRPEPTSGLRMHGSTSRAWGRRARDSSSRWRRPQSPVRARRRPLRAAPRDALRFFYLQRSGCAIDEPARPGTGGRRVTRRCAVAAWTGPDAERLYRDGVPGPLRRVRRLVRRRRLRQVRDQRRRSRCGSCSAPSTC